MSNHLAVERAVSMMERTAASIEVSAFRLSLVDKPIDKDFLSLLTSAGGGADPIYGRLNHSLSGLPIESRHEPSSAMADENGRVNYFSIDVAQEISNMNRSKRAYEAAVKILNASTALQRRAMEIGK